ncbi:RnfABCDGE type electron transport complex subunit D [Lachnoanaerobaculum umeaense]|uniref:Ion-translocating oxidoreductase complex subunit D n=1 Tax=Lachnoanaerobaculum umeaense TaxID=617123 RepID=A0A385Q141_9FIRM|nr:RnfABCDGE type electron transport complex subunit D [Lachnoanaerobaculum umeaense]AYA99294.1 RnfABCDGE type electron transport complex subunit D [Lachnoanaerobaculum umeaense]PZW94316.1 electron transport complex protein RnfD [Lachnoanaerobaculum umeaense]
MAGKFNVSSSPHVRDNSSTSNIMKDVCIAMIPTLAFGCFQFGLSALIVVIGTVLACVLAEYLYEKFMKKPITIGDFSAVVTGLILALNMPPEIPVWMPILGGVFAIIVVKQLYGGLGQNFMNPALAARCFLLISFAGSMTRFSSVAMKYDSSSTPTPLAFLKAKGITDALGQYDLMNMFLGRIPGTIGEVSTIALLIGAVYLVVRKVISLRIPLIYIATVAIFVFVFGDHNPTTVLYHIFGGGLIFGAFFMATDYVSSPVTKMGQVYFAIFIGILTGLFRLFGGNAEGVSYAIIIGNIVAPLLEKATLPKAFGREAKKA